MPDVWRAGVAADRVDVAAKPRSGEDEPANQEDAQEYDDRCRHAEEVAVADPPIFRRQSRHGAPARIDERQAAGGRQHTQSRDERWNVEARDDRSDDGATRNANQHADGQRDNDWIGSSCHSRLRRRGGEARRDDAGKRQYRTNRQIDAAGDDDEGHPERQHAVDRRLKQDVRYVALRKEILVCERQDDNQNDEGEIDAVVAHDPLRDFGSVCLLSFGGSLFRHGLRSICLVLHQTER
jgi:hypothetical protein